MRSLTVALALLLASSAAGQSGAKVDRPPLATSLEVGSLGWSTTRSTTVAVSASGVIYVVWPGKGQQQAPPPAIPLIPAEFSFTEKKEPQWSGVPGISVCRNGSWSKAGLLVDGPKDCDPLWAWCEGERLHLLVVSESVNKCNHLLFDPATNGWLRLAELPFAPTQYEAWRQIGKEVHLACSEGKRVQYLRYDGKNWLPPVSIEASENKTNGVTRVRLTVDSQGAAHVGWWTAHPPPGTHGLATIRDGQVTAAPLKFDEGPILRDHFDLGIDAEGRLLLAYQADLPEDHRDARRVHIRRREGHAWTKPETIGGEGIKLHGDILVVGHAGQTLVSWCAREELGGDRFTLIQSVRRFSIHDGKSWTPSRWCAMETGGFNNAFRLMGANRPGVCIDQEGQVHMAWDASHCLVTQLKK